MRRERGPDRTRFEASYRRSTSRPDGDDGAFTQNELRGLARHEHDFTDRMFGFSSFEAEYDGVNDLALLMVPKLGAGYKVVNTEDVKLSVDAGLAWVSQRNYSKEGLDNNDRFESFLAPPSVRSRT